MKNYVILVDANDQPLGMAEKIYAHQHALRHRAFSIFIYRKINGQYEWLLQQRQSNKYHAGGLWTNTCCSHPAPAENMLLAAQSRLTEEMGIQCPLREMGTFMYQAEVGNGLIEHEFDHVLIGEWQSDIISPHPQEVMDYQWLTLPAIEQALSRGPQVFTPWFSAVVSLIKEKFSAFS